MMKKYTFFLIIIAMIGCSDNDNKIIPSIKPDQSGTFTDSRDANTYGWVRLGGLDWMSENLRYLNTIGNSTIYQLSEGFDGGEMEHYRLLPEYGYMYDFNAAKSACPDGWRLPSDEDWQKLEKALGMSEKELVKYGPRGSFQGYLMQLEDAGLNMKLGGFYSKYAVSYINHFRFFGVYAYFWTSTKDSKEEDLYIFRKLSGISDDVVRESTMDSNRLYIRCVRNPK